MSDTARRRLAVAMLLSAALALASDGFPADFKWGLGTASYQVEGAWNEDGRGLSIWDVFTGADGTAINPGMANGRGQTGNVGPDQYHKFQEDVRLLRALGIKTYRFSISWSRVLPNGTLAGGTNAKGVEYYQRLINALCHAEIEPVATLYHWDLPQALLDDPHSGHRSEYNGWLDERMPELFEDYAALCFALFGDRVKMWYTFNEAWTFVTMGYTGTHAPSLCAWEPGGCARVAATQPYLAAHQVLLAHGRAARAYRTSFQPQQQGKIGMTNNMDFSEPASRSAADVAAAARANEFWLGWFADPVFFGDYPDSMRRWLGGRLPRFTAEESAMLKGSVDVFGINNYAGRFVAAHAPHGREPPSVLTDGGFASSVDPRWPRSNSTWLRKVPWALRKVLGYIQKRYDPAEIYVTENGWSVGAARPADGVCDPSRVGYLRDYIGEMLRAIREDGVRVKGYMAWSMLDNFEWAQGYTERFGLIYTDYAAPDKTRYLKASACWYAATAAAQALQPTAPFDALCAKGAVAEPLPALQAVQLGGGRLDQICAAAFRTAPPAHALRAQGDGAALPGALRDGAARGALVLIAVGVAFGSLLFSRSARGARDVAARARDAAAQRVQL